MTTTTVAGEMEVVSCAICGGAELAPTVSMPGDDYMAILGKTGRKSRWSICKGCGLVFQCPRITAADEKRLYDGMAYYQKLETVLTERYIHNRLAKPPRILAWFDELSVPFPGRRMLEVGSGIGGALAVFKERGWDATGVEPDARMAEFGAKRFGVTIDAGFFLRGTFPSGSFDLVYTNHAYEHFRDPHAITEAIADVLKPGGYLFIAVPTYRDATSEFAWQWFNAGHTYMFTHVSLGNLVAAHGLERRAWRYQPDGAEVWFLAQKTGQPRPRPAEREDWRAVRRRIFLHPLRHVISSPRGWPTVLRCYAEELGGTAAGNAAETALAWLRRRRRAAGA
jgi:SAM-dependent methyltransferase